MNKEVLEFIIVPPFDKRVAVSAAKDRLEDYLSRRFPGYKFTVGPFAPVGDDGEFCVLPIMNFVDPDGKMRMCEQPSRWLLRDIGQACTEFDLAAKRSFAA